MAYTSGSLFHYTFLKGVDPEIFKPVRATDDSVGYDIRAAFLIDRNTRKIIRSLDEKPVIIKPGKSELFGTGIVIAIPPGIDAQVRPRSGLATKYEVQLGNSPGTVDPDYRDQIGILLRNYSDKSFKVEYGMRIAQLVFTKISFPEFHLVKSVKEMPVTRRDTGGFGSTGFMGAGLGTENYEKQIANIDQYMMKVALAAAARSNCVRGCPKDAKGRAKKDKKGNFIGQTRRFGCVFAKGDYIVASGFNAQAPGMPLCAEVGCLRDELNIPSGEQLGDVCRAIHAEEMAILNAANSGVSLEGTTMYVNAEPCLHCARKIASIPLDALVILEGGYSTKKGIQIIRNAGIPVREIRLN